MAIIPMANDVTALLGRELPPERATEVARRLTTGTWTHDRPLSPAELQEMGLSVRVGVEEDERDLLKLYESRFSALRTPAPPARDGASRTR